MIGIVGLIGIFCTYLLQSGTTLVNPAISGISDGLGMTVATVAQIGTLPAIFAVLSSFLVGRFSGKLIKYKTTILVSLFVFVVGGSLPVFIPVWPVILFSRVCAGLGVGVSCTLPPVLIMKFYEDNRQQRNNIGIGSAVASVGGWIGQVAAGILVGIEWNFVFSIYWLGLLGFVLILIGMPEPAPMEVRATEVKAKIQIPTPAILNVVMMFFAFMLFLPGLLMISTVVIGRGLGTGAHTGLVAGMFNISTIVLSVLFSFLYKVFKKFFAVILLALGTLGMVILYFASSLFAAGAGMFLLGAFLVLIPTLIMDNSKIVSPESITFATSLLISANNLGNFLAGPFVQASEVLGKNISIPSLLFGAIGLGILTVVYLFIRIFQKAPSRET